MTTNTRLRFSSAFDTNGVLHRIGTRGGTRPYQNPHDAGDVVASMSSVNPPGVRSGWAGLRLLRETPSLASQASVGLWGSPLVRWNARNELFPAVQVLGGASGPPKLESSSRVAEGEERTTKANFSSLGTLFRGAKSRPSRPWMHVRRGAGAPADSNIDHLELCRLAGHVSATTC